MGELAENREIQQNRLKTLKRENERLQKKLENFTGHVSTIREKEEKFANIEEDMQKLQDEVSSLRYKESSHAEDLKEAVKREENLQQILEQKILAETEVRNRCQ